MHRFWHGLARIGRTKCLPSRFLHDNRGVYAVEFGLIALPFFALLFSIIEVGWVSFNAEQLQAAVDTAARAIRTGQAQTNFPTAQALVQGLLCPTTHRIIPGSWDCSKLIVDVRRASSFAQADMTKSFYRGTTQFCLGSAASIVVLRVAYPLQAPFPLSLPNAFVGLANDVPGSPGWFHILMGSAALKTEPYGSSGSSC